MGHPTAFFLAPQWGPGEGSNIIKFQLQSQFQRFLNQNLCVFSKIKDTEHMKQDFYSVTWVMPQGFDLGVLGGSKI